MCYACDVAYKWTWNSYRYCQILTIATKCYCYQQQHKKFSNTHTQPFNGFCPGQPGCAGTKRNTHPFTPNLIIGHPLSSSSIYNDPWHPLCSFCVLDNPLAQPLSRSSLVILLVLDPQLHTPYISSPNHRHLFVAHAHINAACSAAIPMLCHLYLVSLSAPYFWVCLLA